MAEEFQQPTLDAVARLHACAGSPDWCGDDGNRTGFAMDVDHAFEGQPAFRSHCLALCDGGCLVVAEWVGPGDCLADLARDVFGILGRLAEETMFIERGYGSDEIVYRLTLGCTSGAAAHGHFLSLHFRGDVIRKVLTKTREIEREWDALPRDELGRPILRAGKPSS